MKANVNFASNAQPALEQAKYTVTVSQKTTLSDFEIAGGSLDFVVDTDPALMNHAEVYSVYPPVYASGKYQSCLPHIVLHRHTLPWERRLFKDEEAVPWLALLVFSQEENVLIRQDSFASLMEKTYGVFIPEVSREYMSPDDTCCCVDIPFYLFESVLPTKSDLTYLAHVRKVSLLDKVTDPNVLDGLFSCVIANRYPRAPESGEGAVRHNAHLVSLEGFAEYIDNAQSEISSCETVRMFSLYSWEFMCSNRDFDFMSAAGKMNADTLRPKLDKKFANDTLNKLVTLGYCPVNHVMREGSCGVAWYRPPLLPQKPWEDEIDFYHYADSLLRYDPQSGLMDVTYQAAWQLGRLLALRDRRFASELIAWRLSNKITAAKEQSMRIVTRQLNVYDRNMIRPDSALKEVWCEMMNDLVTLCGKDDPTGLDGADIPQFARNFNAGVSQALSQAELLSMLRTKRME